MSGRVEWSPPSSILISSTSHPITKKDSALNTECASRTLRRSFQRKPKRTSCKNVLGRRQKRALNVDWSSKKRRSNFRRLIISLSICDSWKPIPRSISFWSSKWNRFCSRICFQRIRRWKSERPKWLWMWRNSSDDSTLRRFFCCGAMGKRFISSLRTISNRCLCCWRLHRRK